MWPSEENVEALLSVTYRLIYTDHETFAAEMAMEPFEYQSISGSLHFLIPVTLQSCIDLSLVMSQGFDEKWYLQMPNDIPSLERNAFKPFTDQEPFRFTHEQKELFREENPLQNQSGIPCVGEARLVSTAQKETYLRFVPGNW